MRRNGQRLAAGRPNEQNSEQQRRLKKENAELMEQYIEQYEQKLKREKQQAKTLEEIKGLESEIAFKIFYKNILFNSNMDSNEQPLKEQLEKEKRENRKAHEQLFLTEEQKALIAEEKAKLENDLKKKDFQLDESRKETEEERKGREEERKAKEEERKGRDEERKGRDEERNEKEKEKESKEFYKGQALRYEAERDAAEKERDAAEKGKTAFITDASAFFFQNPLTNVSGVGPSSSASCPLGFTPLSAELKKQTKNMEEQFDEEGGVDNNTEKSNLGLSLEEELKLLEKSADSEDTTRSSNATAADHLPNQVVLQCRDQMMDNSLGQTDETKSGADDNNTKNSDIAGGPSLEKVLKPLNKSPAKEDTKRSSSIAIAAEDLPHQQVVNPCQDQMIAIPLGSTEEADNKKGQICTPSGIKNLPLSSHSDGQKKHEPHGSSANFCVRSGNISVFPTRDVAIRHFPSATTFCLVGLGLILGLIVFMVIIFFFVFGAPF